MIYGILLPWGIREARKLRKARTDSPQPSVHLLLLFSFQMLSAHLCFDVRGSKVKASFIFVAQKERASSYKKPAKIKCSPAHALTPGERLREETPSCRYFLHASDSIVMKNATK